MVPTHHREGHSMLLDLSNHELFWVMAICNIILALLAILGRLGR